MKVFIKSENMEKQKRKKPPTVQSHTDKLLFTCWHIGIKKKILKYQNYTKVYVQYTYVLKYSNKQKKTLSLRNRMIVLLTLLVLYQSFLFVSIGDNDGVEYFKSFLQFVFKDRQQTY